MIVFSVLFLLALCLEGGVPLVCRCLHRRDNHVILVVPSEDSTPQCRGSQAMCLQAACQKRCRVRSVIACFMQ